MRLSWDWHHQPNSSPPGNLFCLTSQTALSRHWRPITEPDLHRLLQICCEGCHNDCLILASWTTLHRFRQFHPPLRRVPKSFRPPPFLRLKLKRKKAIQELMETQRMKDTKVTLIRLTIHRSLPSLHRSRPLRIF